MKHYLSLFMEASTSRAFLLRQLRDDETTGTAPITEGHQL